LTGDATSETPPVLLVSVSNTGVEIAEAEQSRIFDKFYRIPNNDPWKYGGTGLGLALVKKLVEQLNGRIWVESADHLTCLTVALPL
jgi:signal transduction histidine kinase